MFSFSSLAAFATVAFSAVSALPLSNSIGAPSLPNIPGVPSIPAVPSVPGLPIRRQLPDLGAVTGVVGGLPVVGSVVSGLPTDVLSNIPAGVLPRVDTPESIAVILTNVQTQLGPVTATLKGLTAQDITLDVVADPLGQLKDILTGAVVSLKALVGQDVSIILASVEGTAQITVEELGHLVGGVVVTVFEALGAVLKVAGGTVDAAVFDLLVTVGGLVGLILTVVFHLVGKVVVDLLAVVVPLVQAVIPIVLHLNIATVLSILGIKA
ncbi:hypothetical protein C8Q74DRAFT_1219654 [Fomes fomentarius]|nr:hypothetical protein C8Q74DRAFT_1219654 [Fomes fomentarius]